MFQKYAVKTKIWSWIWIAKPEKKEKKESIKARSGKSTLWYYNDTRKTECKLKKMYIHTPYNVYTLRTYNKPLLWVYIYLSGERVRSSFKFVSNDSHSIWNAILNETHLPKNRNNFLLKILFQYSRYTRKNSTCNIRETI